MPQKGEGGGRFQFMGPGKGGGGGEGYEGDFHSPAAKAVSPAGFHQIALMFTALGDHNNTTDQILLKCLIYFFEILPHTFFRVYFRKLSLLLPVCGIFVFRESPFLLYLFVGQGI